MWWKKQVSWSVYDTSQISATKNIEKTKKGSCSQTHPPIVPNRTPSRRFVKEKAFHTRGVKSRSTDKKLCKNPLEEVKVL
jgi:hypothetical protein